MRLFGRGEPVLIELRSVATPVLNPLSVAAPLYALGLPRLSLNLLGKAGGLDHAQLVRAAGDLFVLVVGLELKRDQRPIGVDHPGAADDLYRSSPTVPILATSFTFQPSFTRGSVSRPRRTERPFPVRPC